MEARKRRWRSLIKGSSASGFCAVCCRFVSMGVCRNHDQVHRGQTKPGKYRNYDQLQNAVPDGYIHELDAEFNSVYNSCIISLREMFFEAVLMFFLIYLGLDGHGPCLHRCYCFVLFPFGAGSQGDLPRRNLQLCACLRSRTSSCR